MRSLLDLRRNHLRYLPILCVLDIKWGAFVETPSYHLSPSHLPLLQSPSVQTPSSILFITSKTIMRFSIFTMIAFLAVGVIASPVPNDLTVRCNSLSNTFVVYWQPYQNIQQEKREIVRPICLMTDTRLNQHIGGKTMPGHKHCMLP